MKRILVVLAIFCSSLVYGASIDPTRPFIMTDAREIGFQGAAPDPLLSALISDNYSHTYSLYPTIGWFGLNFNGSGTCIIRIMNTTTKSSWPAEQVTSGVEYSYVVHKNAKFLNISGCNSGTAPANSVLKMM